MSGRAGQDFLGHVFHMMKQANQISFPVVYGGGLLAANSARKLSVRFPDVVSLDCHRVRLASARGRGEGLIKVVGPFAFGIAGLSGKALKRDLPEMSSFLTNVAAA